MALTDHLRAGELAGWFARRMPGSAAVAGQVAAAAATVAPVRPAGGRRVGARHWAEVGGAFGMRLAALVQQAPPYFGLLALVGNGLLSARAAAEIAAGYPSHRGLDPGDAAHALQLHPSRAGWITGTSVTASITCQGWADAGLADLAARTHAYHDQHAPTGCVGTPGAEHGLAPSYGAWSAMEDLYRSGTVSEDLRRLLGGPPPTAGDFRKIVAPAVTEELPALATRLHASGALARLRALAGDPPPGTALGIAAPIFVEHWADGDVLVGDTLIEVKTVLRADDVHRTCRWLWQVLSYAWLDSAADRYGIRAVGLYLARHGVLLRWETDELVSLMVGGRADITALRQEFLAAASRAATLDGAVPRG
ncbi:hypothetical protein [Pseudonocardia dioxanivorans]|uniref:hypothetical protein n=1 Tax=Pseudonocardia dioxanivorans TaxID=240495 RepID=UPI000CD1BBDC|nr:hypothetical protein [Pseudonocardia dioxanivorans]